MASLILEKTSKHASEDVVYHALYCYYFQHVRKNRIAQLFNKDPTTINNWIKKFEEKGIYSRKKTAQIPRKITDTMRAWIVELYKTNPLLFLDETKEKFELMWGVSISATSICRILHQSGFTYKKVERRAIQMRYENIYKYCTEISALHWFYSNLLFLDEVSVDNRGILRNRGYAIRGQRLVHRGEFCRKPRESLLCFLSENGIEETYNTKGTFNRLKFFEAIKEMATSGKCEQYPGRNSIWILDGARIHCDPSIIYFLRSMGIFPIFLPAYCPFFNPIELIFGLIKKKLKRMYKENDKKTATYFNYGSYQKF